MKLRSRLLAGLLVAGLGGSALAATPPLAVSANHHYLQAGGKPFFWLGDTAWLMLSRLKREEVDRYLEARRRQGFNVVQVMVLHSPEMTNRYDAPALDGGDLARPRVTPGADPSRAGEYDFWDHLDWVVSEAEAKGIYVALVPAWGSLADKGTLNLANAEGYGRFLGERYRNHPNIVWLNGGDTRAEMHSAVWEKLALAIKRSDPGHLMTFHPIGRTASSWQYHTAPWLDFNMVQSGHRAYDQEGPSARAEDNWRYIAEDWARLPAKPAIDGEPSYENIPHGLHEAGQPRWTAQDVRRYAWWAVMAGAFGHTYGDNDIMQFYEPNPKGGAFEADTAWEKAMEAQGAGQMRFLRTLIESRPMLERVPDPDMVRDDGQRYDKVLASHGRSYAFAYTYTGRPFTLRLGRISGRRVTATWYSPRDGSVQPAGSFANSGERRFDPPGETAPGNDWVLVLDDPSGGNPPLAAPRAVDGRKG